MVVEESSWMANFWSERSNRLLSHLNKILQFETRVGHGQVLELLQELLLGPLVLLVVDRPLELAQLQQVEFLDDDVHEVLRHVL